MEGITKDSGHRASVSMPSLDANDDFPNQTAPAEDTDPEFVAPESSFVSTASTETVSSSGQTDLLTTDTEAFSSVVTTSEEGVQAQTLITQDTSATNGSSEQPVNDESINEAILDQTSTEPLIEQSSSEHLIEGTSADSLINEPSAEQLIGEVSSDHLINESSTGTETEGSSTEPVIDVAPTLLDEASEVLQEGLDDSQGEEDPSIAIDQFIKKIADEQLSSKRIEERKEEEAKEQIQETETGDEKTDNFAKTMQELQDSTQNVGDPSSLENTLTEDKEPELMDVDSDIHNAATKEFDVGGKEADKMDTEVMESEDLMQMESIEEIQKEINKIPPKKAPNKDENERTQEKKAGGGLENSLNQNENHTEESIEQILGEDLDKPVTPAGDILKNALNKSVKEPSVLDSSEVARDPELIEKAQEEIRKLDVLVCGECHNTFYFTQEFLDHKKGKCPKKSVLTGVESESKPQVWGFVLWKIKQTKDLGDNAPSSWAIYQRWCKLPPADKSAWITAGQAIQFASKVGNARVTEVRPTRQTKQVVVHKVMDQEQPPPPIEFVDSNKENSSSMEMKNTASNIIKKGISRPVKLNNDVTILPSTKKEEYVVEKIMAKRFNPRKKTWEYNIKWENFGHDSNTWEPISNLSHCKLLLDQFEEQLRRMKEEKAKQAAQSPKNRGRPSNPKPTKPNSSNFVPIAPKLDSTPKISNVVGGVSDDYAGGSSSRPTRSSKQNALSQLRQWCGNVSDEDSGGAASLKRKHESDDSDEDFDEKRIKLEDDSDYSDKEISISKPKIQSKKVISTSRQMPVKNGNTGAQQILPSNILIPDANGVVRINQKQLPSLSSGVYIMSKTAGIIKLDSTTSKVATSGGQTIVKVAPKIGQTQIKIVKKDGNTTKQIIQVSPKPLVTSTPIRINPAKVNTSRVIPKIRKEIKKPVLSESVSKIFTANTPKKADLTPTTPVSLDEESDDGLEPLPFPGPDEPIPDLEEAQPEEDFVLDPSTGKIAGIEYVDKPVVIKEEPQAGTPTTSDLENIVKLAAAEVTESDSQNSDSQMELDPLFTGAEREVKQTIGRQTVRTEPRASGPGVVRKVVKYTTTQATPRPVISSIKNSTPVQVPRPRVVQQKVLNQMVSRTPSGSSGQTRTVVRHVIGPQRPSAGGNLNVIRKTIGPAPKPRFNLSPQRPFPSPLQPTRTYSAMGGIKQQNAGPGSKVQVYSTKSAAGNQASSAPGGVRRIGSTIVRTSSGQVNTVQKQPSAQYTQKQPVTRIVQRVVTSPKKPEGQNVLNRSVAQAQPKIVTSTRPKAVISMPSLTDDDAGSSATSSKLKPTQPASQPQKAVPQLAKPTVKKDLPVKVEEPAEESHQSQATESAASAEQSTDWSSFTMADGDNPIYVTGDDGTIYQVAGQNEQGQTILITQGPDGQQQCLLVTNEIGEMTSDEQASPNAADTNTVAETVNEPATVVQEQGDVATASSVADSIQTPLQIKTDASEMEEMEDGVQDQVVAQVVRAEPPSPGGTHKVVVMLPDGNLMVTQVSPEEYASLELE